MSDIETKTVSRNRESTERRIISAATDILIADGFTSFGVNAIARAAGCDKQLIYKYFGGLNGVVDAIGADLRNRFGTLIRKPRPNAPPDHAQAVEQMLLEFLTALRNDKLVQRIIAWEVTENSLLVRRLSEARTAAMREWAAQVSELAGRAPRGFDISMITMLMLAAIQHFVLSSTVSGRFAGLQLALDSDWYRVEVALRHIVRSALAAPSDQDEWIEGISITSPS